MTKDTHVIVLDTETGGLNPIVDSLLEIGIIVADLKGNIKEEFEVLINPLKPVWTAKALGINDYLYRLAQNPGAALDESEAATRLMVWSTQILKKHKHLHFMGHNIPFDIAFVDTWMSQCGYREWSSMFGRRFRDTCGLSHFLKDVGLINPEKASLEETCKYLGIKIDGQHTSLGDARATYKVYMAFMDLVKKRARLI